MNGPEQRVAERLRADGWKVIRNGWPDFLCVRGEEIKAVEVKSANDVQPHQKTNHDLLRASGIPVEVEVIAKESLEQSKYVAVNIRLESSLHTRASELAFKTGRSLSKMLNILIKEALAARSNGQKELRHV